MSKTPEEKQKAFEEIQKQYNQFCAELGHAQTQIKVFAKQIEEKERLIEKLMNKASNIAKEAQVKAPAEDAPTLEAALNEIVTTEEGKPNESITHPAA